MKSVGLYSCAAILAGFMLIVPGVSEDNLTFFSPNGQVSEDVSLPDLSDPFIADQEVVELNQAAPTVNSLREQYLEAARQRASLMNADELRDALELEEKKVAELRAQLALKQVEDRLQQITTEYSETTAGRQARFLLMSLQKSNAEVESGRFDVRRGETRDFDDGAADSRFRRSQDRPDPQPQSASDDVDSGAEDSFFPNDVDSATPSPRDPDVKNFDNDF